MAHQLAHGLCRSIEFILVAMVGVCMLWLGLLIFGITQPVA